MIYFKQKGGGSSGSSILNKLDATVPPTVNDDSGDGYSVGSLWIDVTDNEAYRCVDSTVGAAIWLNTTVEIADLGDIVTHDADEFAGADHNHDEDYSALGHNHDEAYAALGHDHDEAYSALGHDHDEDYSALGHNHDETYSPLSHTHSEKADKVVVDEYDEYDAPEGYVAIFDAYGNLAIGNFKLTELAPKVIDFVDCSSSLSLSAAQCSGTILTNYSQGAEDVQINLPTIFKGLSLVCVIGTTQAGNTWKLTAPAGSKFYLDGVAGSTGESIIVTPAVGNLITVFAFQTGADTFDLIAQTGQGTWTAGA